MPIAWAPIETALRSWMTQGTGLIDGRVIWANQAAPRPRTPFVVMNRKLAGTRLGAYPEERTDAASPGVVTRVDQKKFTVSCQAYGPGAHDLMEAAQEYLDTYAARALFKTAGIAVVDRGKTTDLTKLLQTSYEERAQLDVIFGLAVVTTETVGTIDTVGVTVTLQDPGGAAATFTQTFPTS